LCNALDNFTTGVVWARGWKSGDTLEVIAPDFGAYFLMTIKEGVASLDEEE
jgi:hypothetical protein